MIQKILIANRGEIARRIICTAKKMGISTVAIHTNDEKDAAWAKEAEFAVLLSEDSIVSTYLSPNRILKVAKEQGCDAIHPGYGFLSENAEFAKACDHENIIFIGPKSESIQLMGNKNQARNFVSKIGIAIPQGITGSVNNILENSNRLKFPVLIKAVGGGGGKAMHIVRSKSELATLLNKASTEAKKWFGNSEVYVEQYFENARHIEVQVLADVHGNYIHLFERECTIQRNYQKIIEEAPSPTLNSDQRNKICDAALKIAKHANYCNAGTIEFLWQDGKFYFLEMNTRIQVEHTVTEEITRIDIVEQQINIANNFELNLRQKDINISGHAIQCRIYSEDAINNFKPTAGFISQYIEPNIKNIRIDSSYNNSIQLSANYDGLIAKIIAHKAKRIEAIQALSLAIENYIVHGVIHNGTYINTILSNSLVINNEINTRFIQNNHQELITVITNKKQQHTPFLLAAYLLYNQSKSKKTNIWSVGKQNAPVKHWSIYIGNKNENCIQINKHNSTLLINNKQKYDTNHLWINEYILQLTINKETKQLFITKNKGGLSIQIESFVYEVRSQNYLDESQIIKNETEQSNEQLKHVVSPLYGTISDININRGQAVKQGDLLFTIESMKTENQILSSGNGTVDKILFNTNDKVKENDILVLFKN